MTSTVSPRRPAARIATAVAAAVGLTVAVAGCSTVSGTEHETGHDAGPSATASATVQENQCGGTTIDHSAPITSSTELLIDAPLDRVWDVHTDVESWDEWQPTVLTIERLDPGAFASDSRFRWTTPVPETAFSPADTMTVTSSVQQMEPGRCLLWEGPGIGESLRIDKGIHLWTFTEVEGGTLVHTEESWDAELLAGLNEADAATASAQLGGGLDEWLRLLKIRSEAADA